MGKERVKAMPEIIFPSEWLKINENVFPGDTIQFKDVGRLDPERDTWEFNVEIFHEGISTETKKFTLNKTNSKAVSAIYGTNSDSWIGKSMVVNAIKVRNPQNGQLVDSIALSAPQPSNPVTAGQANVPTA